MLTEARGGEGPFQESCVTSMTHLPGKAGARRHSPAAREAGAVGRKRPESVRRGGVRAAPSKNA